MDSVAPAVHSDARAGYGSPANVTAWDLRRGRAMEWIVRNWLIVAAALLLLTAGGSLLEGAGLAGSGALLLTVGWWAAAVLALVDGVRRALGGPSFLGTGRGANRALAVVQIALALLLIRNLLSPTL